MRGDYHGMGSRLGGYPQRVDRHIQSCGRHEPATEVNEINEREGPLLVDVCK